MLAAAIILLLVAISRSSSSSSTVLLKPPILFDAPSFFVLLSFFSCSRFPSWKRPRAMETTGDTTGVRPVRDFGSRQHPYCFVVAETPGGFTSSRVCTQSEAREECRCSVFDYLLLEPEPPAKKKQTSCLVLDLALQRIFNAFFILDLVFTCSKIQ